ncbi:hypothetical protein LXM50_08665 [Microbacterium sp. Au-Mic1]|uniref:hypothetical protein n=1 Tax=Microbacterium sp. Au-Mic1 TaxID=2906457 RepID=UPI001E5C9F7D|nr:hypothetical protein [Microbacterium sp. Au-Mic1]MCE4026044.1 hypothetical protein [Microbacterium sp. Au-Mic1]
MATEAEVRRGATMLVRTSQGDITATFGVTKRHGSAPVSPDDPFRIGSDPNAMTGTAGARPPAATITISPMKRIYGG